MHSSCRRKWASLFQKIFQIYNQGFAVCMDSIDLMKGYMVPQFDNAEIFSCWVMEEKANESTKLF